MAGIGQKMMQDIRFHGNLTFGNLLQRKGFPSIGLTLIECSQKNPKDISKLLNVHSEGNDYNLDNELEVIKQFA